MENVTTIEYNRWILNEYLSGPVIAFFVTLQLVLALPSNLFIILHSLSHRKLFNKSAIILLFSLSISNLLVTLFYMPFAIVASGAEEWILGGSDYSRNTLCQIHGFVYEYSVTVTGHILVIISIDRFLYIVRATHHTKIMSWKVTLGIMAAVWILPIFWCLSPYYGSGLGFYDWSVTNGGCAPFILTNNFPVTIAYIIYIFILFSIIVITTVWTFVFTHKFLKKNLQIRQEGHNPDTEKHIYLQKVRNLVGIFGALLIANSFSWIPYFISIFYTLIGVNLDKIPVEIDAILFIISLSNNAANPIIQIYFRRDLRESLKHIFHKLKRRAICSNRQKILKKDVKEKRIEENIQKHNCICNTKHEAVSAICRSNEEVEIPLEHLETQTDKCDESRSTEYSSGVISSSAVSLKLLV